MIALTYSMTIYLGEYVEKKLYCYCQGPLIAMAHDVRLSLNINQYIFEITNNIDREYVK